MHELSFMLLLSVLRSWSTYIRSGAAGVGVNDVVSPIQVVIIMMIISNCCTEELDSLICVGGGA